MDFMRRAWLFTKAKLGRTALLVGSFSVILTFVLSGLIINSAANVSIENAKKAAGATVSLSVNMENVVKQSQSDGAAGNSSTTGGRFNLTLPTIDQVTADKIGNLDGVKSYSLTYTANANADSGITKVSETSGNSQGNFPGGPMGSQGDFTLTGTNDLAANTSFTGSYKIESGRAIQASDEGTDHVIIESTLASQNNLSVGSTFTLKDSNNKTYTMTVVGIYVPTGSSTDTSIQYMNTMYTALSMTNTIKGTTGMVSGATYSLLDPAKADTFVSTANKQVNNENFQVAKNDQAYQNVKSSLGSVASFARNIVWIVAVAGALILGLIVVLMVRERRFEIGVLMSLGESKLKVVGQFFAELFLVMIVSVGIAIAAGNVVGNVVGQQLLKQETTVQTTSNRGMPTPTGGTTANSQQPQRPSGGGFGGAFGFGQSRAETQALEKLNVKMSASGIASLVGIAILITLIAVGLASVGILRLNPKQVLTN